MTEQTRDEFGKPKDGFYLVVGIVVFIVVMMPTLWIGMVARLAWRGLEIGWMCGGMMLKDIGLEPESRRHQ